MKLNWEKYKYQKARLLWEQCKYKKVTRARVIQRVARGREIEKAIRYIAKSTKRLKIDGQGRQCTVCGEYKLRSQFTKAKTGYRGHDIRCRECKKKLRLKYRADKEIRQKENAQKREYRRTEHGKLITKKYNFYRKVMGNNIEILKKIGERPQDRETVMKNVELVRANREQYKTMHKKS